MQGNDGDMDALSQSAKEQGRSLSKRKQAISLTIEPTLLARVDACAERLGLSRAAAISFALSRFVDAEDKKASR